MSQVKVMEFNKPMSMGLFEENKFDNGPCSLSQQNIKQCRWKDVEDGICRQRRTDGSVCNWTIDHHFDNGDWKRLKDYLASLGNQSQKQKFE